MTRSSGQPPAPSEFPVALTIAGSDSGGGAGIQADLKTMEATGAFATSVLTAVTAQNTTGVASSHVLPAEEISAQYDAVTDDFDVRAAKTGMLATAEVVETVARWTREAAFPVVVDPVMVAESGDRLLTDAAETTYEDLVAAATLVTPNTAEAAVLTDIEPTKPDEQAAAGERLVNMGAGAALVTGGHTGGEEVHDTLVTPARTETFTRPRVVTDATHGSGCTLSSAIAARLAQGDDLTEAVAAATAFTSRAVRYGHAVGEGPGAVHHLVDLRNDADRAATREAVTQLSARLAGLDTTGVVGVSRYGERPDDVVVGDTHEALTDIMLSVRDAAPNLRFAVGLPQRVAGAVDELGVPVAETPVACPTGADTIVIRNETLCIVGSDLEVVAAAVRDAFDAATPPKEC